MLALLAPAARAGFRDVETTTEAHAFSDWVVWVALLIGVAYSNEMTPRMAFLIAAGVAPLHQRLLLRYLYGRFIERNGRTPQFVGRASASVGVPSFAALTRRR
jgi:hypothetical protein